MTPEKFDQLFDQFTLKLRRLGLVKGGEYSRSSDRLSNFKINAQLLDLTPFDVWAVYAGKHWDAIQTYVKDVRAGKVRPASEPITGRAEDLALYMLLFVALYEDARAKPEDPVLSLVWESEHAPDQP